MDSARKIIVVPAGGICSRALREALGLSTAEVNPLLGDEICQPRDYRWNGSTDIFNIDGVRRLVRVLELKDVEVLAEGEEVPVRPEPMAGPRPQRLPHYMRDLSED
jgi:hypothetical protein